MSRNVTNESASDVLNGGTLDLYTPEEAEEDYGDTTGSAEGPYILAIGTDGGYFGLNGTRREIEAVLLRALDKVRQS